MMDINIMHEQHMDKDMTKTVMIRMPKEQSVGRILMQDMSMTWTP